jgi:hypothetical protein
MAARTSTQRAVSSLAGWVLRIWLVALALMLATAVISASSLGGSPGFGPLKLLACGVILLLLLASKPGFWTTQQEQNVALLAATSTLMWGVLEAGFFAARYWRLNGRLFSRAYVNRPCASFDPIAGYRWQTGPTRIVRIMNGELVFDNVFRANNAGYVSSQDFQTTRKGPYRVVVLGDSFTAGEFLEKPWPDRLAALLPGRPEVYSFGIDGGGLLNWHSIFFGEVVPRYAFDALLIASFIDNLERDFCVFHSQGGSVLLGRFPALPGSQQEFEASFLPQMVPLYSIRPDGEIDGILAALQQGSVPPTERAWPQLTGKDTALLSGLRLGRAWFDSRRPVRAGTYADAVARYGSRRMRLLSEIIEYCRERRIPVVLASVPRLGQLTGYLGDAKKTSHQAELEAISTHHQVGYFDGYAAFAGVTPLDIQRYWLKYDGHWNQRGADRFAESLATALEQRGVLHAALQNAKRPSQQ